MYRMSVTQNLQNLTRWLFQKEAEKIEREAQSRRIAAIEAALLHHG